MHGLHGKAVPLALSTEPVILLHPVLSSENAILADEISA